jgi:hypothetical protein
MNTGIAQFFYTRQLPAGAVAIAQVKADPTYAIDLIDVNNVVTTGTLRVWRFSTDGIGPVDSLTGSAFATASGLGIPVTISGARTYVMDSQFFELTNIFAADGITPLFYQHSLDSAANSITITDDSGNVITTTQLIQNGVLYHSLNGALYWIRYVDQFGILQKKLLKYDPVIGQAPFFPEAGEYALSGNALLVNDVVPYSIRFTQFSIFGVSVPYGNLPNVPWFPRLRFPINPLLPEWAAMSFNPIVPYLLASWVTGTVIDDHILQLERPDIYPDGNHWPDILVFDSNYNVKFALEGTSTDVASRRGTSYPWKRGQIVDVDFHTAYVQVLSTLDPTDIIFGFYSYKERDVIFTAIDCNPFTNPSIRNCVVRFYSRSDSDPFRRLFYQVIDFTGDDVAGLTNDPLPVAGAWTTNTNLTIIGDLFVGASISPKNLTITDARVRGGGLIPAEQGIDQAANFWDIGYLDGKPYPIGGTLVVYLPSSILNTMTRTDVQQRVDKTLPLGALAIIRYYDQNFQEIV